MENQIISINLIPNLSTPAVVRVSQYDVGRPLVFKVYDGTSPADLTGVTAVIEGTKKSGLGFSESGTVTDNTVTLNTTLAMTQEDGSIPAEIRFSKTGEDVGTANFILAVEKTPHAEGTTDGTTETMADLQSQLDALDTRVEALEAGGGGGGLTEAVKSAMLQIAQKVAYIDEHGQDYYDDLYDALYAITAITLNANSISMQTIGATSQLTATTTPEGGNVTWSSSNTSVATVSATGLVTSVAYGSATITATAGSASATCSVVVAQATCTGISATYTQSGSVYEDTSLDSLKSDLVVTASWSDSTTTTLSANDYTLSGTLEVGTSTITVSYGGQTDTFDVTVSTEEWTVVRTIGDNYEVGRVNQGSGSVDTSQTGWYTSTFIEVPDGATSYSRDTSRTSDWYLVWYDSEQAFLGNGESGTYSGNGVYGGGYTDGNGVLWNVVPSTAKYCKVSWRTNATYTSVTFAHNKIIDENTTPVADKLYAYTYDPTATGNSFNNDDFICCSGMAYAQIRPVKQRSITFYDSDFLVVSTIARATNIGNNAVIPSDAVYLKCQCENTIATAGNMTTKIGTGLIMFTDETKESW